MFAHGSSCRFMQLNFVLIKSGLHGRPCFRQQTTRIIHFENSRLLRPPILVNNVRQKSSALANEIGALRVVWNKIFGKYLLATNIISSGVLMAIGDLAAQEIRYRRGTVEKREYDWNRLGRMFIVGALQGPMHHYVYRWMDTVMPVQTLKNITRKILIDQFVMSPICILMFFYSACFLEHKSLEETNDEILEKFHYIYLMDWAVWPAAQYINFRFFDLKYRVMYVNVVTAIYNVFMSFMKHEFVVKV